MAGMSNAACGAATGGAPLRLTVIAAATMANGLGAAGALPWRLKGEMAYFRAATTSLAPQDRSKHAINAVIMGRKTWEGIPTKFRPLKDRVNIVISRSQNAQALGISSEQDAWLFFSLDQAIDFLKQRRDSDSDQQAALSRIFIIGGAQLYSECISKATSAEHRSGIVDRLLITRILTPDFPECDAFLSEIRDAQQVDQDLHLYELAKAQDSGQAATPQALQHRQWEKATSEQLREYLAFGEGGPSTELEDVIVTEKGVSYQFQMWTRSPQS